MVKNAREENQRRGGWVRIFPTAETWSNYGSMLEYSSQNNLILHEHLYPNATRKAQRLNSRRAGRNREDKARFDFGLHRYNELPSNYSFRRVNT